MLFSVIKKTLAVASAVPALTATLPVGHLEVEVSALKLTRGMDKNIKNNEKPKTLCDTIAVCLGVGNQKVETAVVEPGPIAAAVSDEMETELKTLDSDYGLAKLIVQYRIAVINALRTKRAGDCKGYPVVRKALLTASDSMHSKLRELELYDVSKSLSLRAVGHLSFINLLIDRIELAVAKSKESGSVNTEARDALDRAIEQAKIAEEREERERQSEEIKEREEKERADKAWFRPETQVVTRKDSIPKGANYGNVTYSEFGSQK